MEIKPVVQIKKLAYPLATVAVVGTAALSGCQQQINTGNPPQFLGGIIVETTKGAPSVTVALE